MASTNSPQGGCNWRPTPDHLMSDTQVPSTYPRVTGSIPPIWAQPTHLQAAQGFTTGSATQPQANPPTIRQINQIHHTSIVVPQLNIPQIDESTVCTPFPTYDIGHLGYNAQQPPRTVRQLMPPPPTGNSSQCFSQHTYQTSHRADNLHPILFELEPAQQAYRDVKVPLLEDVATGAPVAGSRGVPLRFFSFLPRHVPWDITGHWCELWFNLDQRLEPNDILDRMASGDKKPNFNTLTRRRGRFRDVIGARSIFSGRKYPTECEVDMFDNMTPRQLQLNTTMLVDDANNRLLKPVLSNDFRRIQGYVKSGLNIDHFTQGRFDQPSKRTRLTVELNMRLQNLARLKNLGNGPKNWKALKEEDKPSWWDDRKKRSATNGQKSNPYHNPNSPNQKFGDVVKASRRRISEIDNLHHHEWIDVLAKSIPADSFEIKRPHMNRASRIAPARTRHTPTATATASRGPSAMVNNDEDSSDEDVPSPCVAPSVHVQQQQTDLDLSQRADTPATTARGNSASLSISSAGIATVQRNETAREQAQPDTRKTKRRQTGEDVPVFLSDFAKLIDSAGADFSVPLSGLQGFLYQYAPGLPPLRTYEISSGVRVPCFELKPNPSPPQSQPVDTRSAVREDASSSVPARADAAHADAAPVQVSARLPMDENQIADIDGDHVQTTQYDEVTDTYALPAWLPTINDFDDFANTDLLNFDFNHMGALDEPVGTSVYDFPRRQDSGFCSRGSSSPRTSGRINQANLPASRKRGVTEDDADSDVPPAKRQRSEYQGMLEPTQTTGQGNNERPIIFDENNADGLANPIAHANDFDFQMDAFGNLLGGQLAGSEVQDPAMPFSFDQSQFGSQYLDTEELRQDSQTCGQVGSQSVVDHSVYPDPEGEVSNDQNNSSGLITKDHYDALSPEDKSLYWYLVHETDQSSEFQDWFTHFNGDLSRALSCIKLILCIKDVPLYNKDGLVRESASPAAAVEAEKPSHGLPRKTAAPAEASVQSRQPQQTRADQDEPVQSEQNYGNGRHTGWADLASDAFHEGGEGAFPDSFWV